jgi:hypothetical protein
MFIYLVLNHIACLLCEGYGNIIGIDAELMFPNTTLSVLKMLFSMAVVKV